MNKKKKSNIYYETFEILANFSCEASKFLQKTLEDFNPEHLPKKMSEMHSIEHNADNAKHDMMTKLAKEFVTPIEREDIIQLAGDLDDVTDQIEDVLMRIYMYNISEIRPEALKFADVIVRCCESLRVAMVEFPNFHKSDCLHQMIIGVNTMEEEGDELYVDAMRSLYCEHDSALEVISWSETFDRLEKCCDSCEHVANQLESIIMKNS